MEKSEFEKKGARLEPTGKTAKAEADVFKNFLRDGEILSKLYGIVFGFKLVVSLKVVSRQSKHINSSTPRLHFRKVIKMILFRRHLSLVICLDRFIFSPEGVCLEIKRFYPQNYALKVHVFIIGRFKRRLP